jgi:hypothetical protein
MGVDILNPAQINARGMGPRKLEQTFGDKLVLWGGAPGYSFCRPVNCQDSGNSEAGFAKAALQNSEPG